MTLWAHRPETVWHLSARDSIRQGPIIKYQIARQGRGATSPASGFSGRIRCRAHVAVTRRCQGLTVGIQSHLSSACGAASARSTSPSVIGSSRDPAPRRPKPPPPPPPPLQLVADPHDRVSTDFAIFEDTQDDTGGATTSDARKVLDWGSASTRGFGGVNRSEHNQNSLACYLILAQIDRRRGLRDSCSRVKFLESHGRFWCGGVRRGSVQELGLLGGCSCACTPLVSV